MVIIEVMITHDVSIGSLPIWRCSTFLLYMLLCSISCSPPSTDEAKVKSEESELHHLYVKGMMSFLEDQDGWSSNASWDRSYYIDADSLSYNDFKESAAKGDLIHLFVHNKLKNMVSTKAARPDSNRISFHYSSEVVGFTASHIEEHWFVPTFMDIYMNEYDNLFLSLGTSARAPFMATVVFDKNTGRRLVQFNDQNYDGSYLTGRLINEIDSVGDVRAVVTVGDSIYFQDFTREHLLHGVEAEISKSDIGQ